MKTALLFGSTGLVGGHVLNYLIQNSNYSKIKLFVRSFTEFNDPKIEIIQIDFNNLNNMQKILKETNVFFALVRPKKNRPTRMNIEKLS